MKASWASASMVNAGDRGPETGEPSNIAGEKTTEKREG